MADATDTLLRLLEDPEVQAAADSPDAEENALPADVSPLSMLPPDLMSRIPSLMSALGPMLGTGSGKKDDKTVLLLALKPYMSPQRCDAIDKLIMFGRIGEVFKQLR